MSNALEKLALPLLNISGHAARATEMPHITALIGIALFALVMAFIACYFVVRSENWHGRFSYDGIESGPNKFHVYPTPRVGGFAIVCSLVGCIWMFELQESWYYHGFYLLLLAAVPAFASGFGDDVTKHVSVSTRLILTISAGAFASILVGATLRRVDVPGLDTLLQWPVFAVAFTAFAVGGIANAINLIDGYHGLAAGFAVLVLAALAAVSTLVGDHFVLIASIVMIGALLGFLAWNYPGGKIFLGDGGAYLLGFWIAALSVLLVARHPEVSPWFPLVLLEYPIFEALFSIYRRQFLHGRNPGHADALHLHQLIYRRLIRVSTGSPNKQDINRRNSLVALYVWCGTMLFSLPALFVWHNTPALIMLALLFCAAYIWLYFRLIRWRAPVWMIRFRL